MKPGPMYIAQNSSELRDLLYSMLLNAPKFVDNTGRLPFLNLDYVFQQLHAGLAHNRTALGEERYVRLTAMSHRMRALFEADPEDETGETLQGHKIIHEMLDILKQAKRKAR